MKRIKGLDSIRFICAIYVLIGHLGLPLPEILSSASTNNNLKNAGKLIGLIFNGPAAVIIFLL
jgi:peptidoglycan/LPS O-acetylase OafA/YrhL